MNNRNTSNRLERRAERAGKQVGAAPKPYRQRSGASRTPVKVGGAGGFNWTLLLGAAGAFLVVAIIVYAVIQSTSKGSTTPDYIKAELDDSTSLPGQYIKPNPGPDGVFPSSDDRLHFADGTKWPFCTQNQIDSGDVGSCYTSNPPTSGQHAVNPGGFQIYENPLPKENALHSMEHGGVVIWYNTDDQSIIDQIKQIYKDESNRKKLVVVTKYTEMEPNTIAVTAWTRLDKFSVSDFNRKRIVDFIEAHSKRFNPEGF
ncbi:MAG TPA: DUF3105 domain-containing protein [Dehalococcoidia bacterium]